MGLRKGWGISQLPVKLLAYNEGLDVMVFFLGSYDFMGFVS